MKGLVVFLSPSSLFLFCGNPQRTERRVESQDVCFLVEREEERLSYCMRGEQFLLMLEW